MDAWDFLDEVDVIGLWPEEQRKAVESTKWSERKDSLQALVDIIEKNPRLSSTTMTRYGEIMDNLKKIIARDSNVNVVAVSVKLLTLLARGLRTKFACFISMIFGVVLEKTKEKKAIVRDLLSDCLDALADTCPIERLTKDLTEHIAKPNPQMKQLINSFLYRLFKKQLVPPLPFLKDMLPLIVKHCSDSDKDVRESSFTALGSAKRLLGSAIDNFLKPIFGDEAKMIKINEYCDKASKEFSEEQASIASRQDGMGLVKDDEENNENCDLHATGSNSLETAALDPWVLIDPVNIWEFISKDYGALIESKKWQERKEAMDALHKILLENKRILPGVGNTEKIGVLVKIIEKDVNINVAAGAAVNLKLIADGLRTDYAPYTSKSLNAAFEKFKEKKPTLKDPLCEMVDSIACTTRLDAYVEEIVAGLSKSNPVSRTQTALFVSRVLSENNQVTLPKEAAKGLASALVKLTNDADSGVRDASFLALGALKRCIGESAISGYLDGIEAAKRTKIEEACKRFIEERENNASESMMRLYKSSIAVSENVAPARQATTSIKRPPAPAPVAPASLKTTSSNRAPVAPVRVAPKPRLATSGTRPTSAATTVRRRSLLTSRDTEIMRANTQIRTDLFPRYKADAPSYVTMRRTAIRSNPASTANSRTTSPTRKACAPNVRSASTARPIARPVTSTGVRPNIVRPATSQYRPDVVLGSRPTSGIRPNVVHSRSGGPLKLNVKSSVGPGGDTVNGQSNIKPVVAEGRPTTGMRPPTAINIGVSKMRPPTSYRAQ